jgi:hypothetical protein
MKRITSPAVCTFAEKSTHVRKGSETTAKKRRRLLLNAGRKKRSLGAERIMEPWCVLYLLTFQR